MKILILKSDLKDALEKASRAVAKKASNEILTGFLFEAKEKELTITGYNLQIGISIKIPTITIQEEGSCVLPPTIIDIAKRTPEEQVIITEEKGIVKIKSGRSTRKIMSLKAEDYPSLPEIKDDNVNRFEIEGELFKQMLENTLYATSQENSRPILTGTLFSLKDGLATACALDGIQCSLSEHTIENKDCDFSFVIHNETSAELIRLLPDKKIDVCLTARHITLRVDDMYIISRLIEGVFPDYNACFPQDNNLYVYLDGEFLKESIERALSVQGTFITPVVFTFNSSDTMTLTTNSSAGSSEEEIEIKAPNFKEEVRIGINPKFLLNSLNSLNSNEIILKIKSSIAPMTLTAKELKGEKRLVTPMRLPKE